MSEKKQILSILAAFAVMLSLSACRAEDTGQVSQASETVSTTAITSETTAQNAAETTTADNSNDYPAYPLPDGWTFERICNLFEIDGVPLSLSFTNEDFENISEKIEVKSEDFVNNYFHDVYLNNELIATIGKTDGEEFLSYLAFTYVNDNQEIIDAMTFAGHSLDEVEQIYNFMDNNFTESHEYIEDIERGTGFKVYVFTSENEELSIDLLCYYTYDNTSRLSVIINLNEMGENINERFCK